MYSMRLPILKPTDFDLQKTEATCYLPALSIVGSYVLMKNTTTTDKQATDLCICSWVALQTYLQVCCRLLSIHTLLAQPAGAELRLCLQSSDVNNRQLYCAVLTADSVSWFQLLNATTLQPITASIIEESSGKQSTAQNALTQQDSAWLSSAFTKTFCSMAAHLHVYGADPAVDQSPGRTPPAPDQLYKLAITNAIMAVKDSLYSASTLLLASPSGQGTIATSHPASLLGDCLRLSCTSVELTITSDSRVNEGG